MTPTASDVAQFWFDLLWYSAMFAALGFAAWMMIKKWDDHDMDGGAAA